MGPALSTLSFNFAFRYQPSENLFFEGDIHYTIPSLLGLSVTETDTDENPALRLTGTDKSDNPKTESVGRLLYATDLCYSYSADFNTTVTFNIKGTEEAPLSGGLAFFIVPTGHVFPSIDIGGNLGIFKPSDKNQHVFAVSFDINPNDPGYIRLGIHLGSRKPTAFTKVPDDFIGKNVTLTVSYVTSTEVVTASASASTTDGSPSSYQVSCMHDLSDTLPSSVQVGLASSTIQTIHDVESWTFDSALVNE